MVVGRSQVQCYGATVTLQCTLTGDHLIWQKADGDINLIRGEHTSSTSGSYQWELIELDEYRLKSSISFIINNENIVNCTELVGNRASIHLSIEGIQLTLFSYVENIQNKCLLFDFIGPPGAPGRPLTGLDRIVRVNKSFSEVTVVWSIPDTNNAHISSYEVAVFPPISLPASGVIAGGSPLFQARQLTLTLQHGQQYYITVRAKSCDDTVQGSVSTALRVNVQG